MSFDRDWLVFDTESDGYVYESTVMWCMVIYERGTDNFWEFGPKQMEQGLKLLNTGRIITAHNHMRHDEPLIKKHYPNHLPTGTPWDSFVISQTVRPDRLIPKRPEVAPGEPKIKAAKSGHSLDAQGIRMRRYKPIHEDWTQFSDEMMHRCREDVEINEGFVVLLEGEIQRDSMLGIDYTDAFKIEHAVSRRVSKAECNGWLLDKQAGKALVTRIDKEVADLDEVLTPLLPHRCKILAKKIKEADGGGYQATENIYVGSGHYHKTMAKYWGIDTTSALEPDCLVMNGAATEENPGGFCKVEFPQVDLNSNSQTIEYLLSIGWVPDEYTAETDKGGGNNPKLTESSFKSLPPGLGSDIGHRRVLLSRRGHIKNLKEDTKGILNLVRSDGRISGGNNPQGTPTARSRHSGIVNTPKAESSVYLGKEIRDLYIAPEGCLIIGDDASGLEARMLAHFIGCPKLIQTILDSDIHTANLELGQPLLHTRSMAKEFYYAFLYGGGDPKIGSIVGGGAAEGRQLKELFFSKLPGLKILIDSLDAACKRGWIKGLDGRKMPIRHKHAALNTLLQGAGALVMKMAMLFMDQMLVKNGLGEPYTKMLLFYHDEFQQEIPVESVEQAKRFNSLADYEAFKAHDPLIWSAPVALGVKDDGSVDKQGPQRIYYSKVGEIAVLAIRQAGIYFKLNCPLDAEYKIGRTWAETH